MGSSDPITAHRSSMINNLLTVLRNDGIVFIKEVKAEFKQFLFSMTIETTKHSHLCKSLIKYLDIATMSCYKMYTQPENERSLGKVI